jgi:hypothetical protein
VRNIVKLVLAAVVAAVMLGVAQAETPKRGGTLTYAVTAEAPTYDCHATTTYAAIHTHRARREGQFRPHPQADVWLDQ